MLSQKTRYALKALMYLARAEKESKGPVLISDMAKEGKMPQKFLEAILLELKKNGILVSKKGKGGGYALGKSAEEIKFGTVIRALEGPLALLPCVSQIAYQKCDECKDEESCGIKILFKEVRDATSQILDSTSLAKVLAVEEKIKGDKNLVYFI